MVVRRLADKNGIKAAFSRGICLAGQMHTTVVLDKAGKPYRPAILWLDQRNAGQVCELRAKVDNA